MIGYPVENDSSLTEETVRLNQEIKPDYTQISIFYPFPGSEMYEQCVEGDLIDPAKADLAVNYYEESVLRGVSLKQKRAELDALLNPGGDWSQLFWKRSPRKFSGLVALARRHRAFSRLLPSSLKRAMKRLLA